MQTVSVDSPNGNLNRTQTTTPENVSIRLSKQITALKKSPIAIYASSFK